MTNEEPKTSFVKRTYALQCTECDEWHGTLETDEVINKQEAASFFEKKGWIFEENTESWRCPECKNPRTTLK